MKKTDETCKPRFFILFICILESCIVAVFIINFSIYNFISFQFNSVHIYLIFGKCLMPIGKVDMKTEKYRNL